MSTSTKIAIRILGRGIRVLLGYSYTRNWCQSRSKKEQFANECTTSCWQW